ncbi:MAG: hypothetical protein CFH22_01537 [Alphaproteobacteria bacterium MarineAlpha5_Bin12]|nr:MAG: hypothetical protein CFH22_01537 [Alphaproteobacteria bacterium MarineAlpha5_Bin12]|tara:strand:- start:1785 stop:3935 length:2151 start_codon:yes stop_codon:yes gene_type:complete
MPCRRSTKLFFLVFFIFLISNYLKAESLKPSINQPFGLFFMETKQSELDNDIFIAPTLKTDVQVNIQGLLTTTTVKQYFINPTTSWMEAIYLFPLPDKSSVDFLRMKVGERFIEGEIKEKIEAEEIYNDAKKKGQKASVVSSNRTNIFKTKVANIAPGELIVIEIRYHDVLEFKSDRYFLRIPTVINHRYSMQQNEQDEDETLDFGKLNSDIHSPINQQQGFTINPYSISINLNTGFHITEPQSSTHDIIFNSISPSHYQVSLAEGGMSSTKDFLMFFSPIKSNEPYVEIYGEDIGEDLYLYGLINPQVEKKDLVLKDDSSITIIADVSGSMSGNSIRKMKRALKEFINQLPEHHFINIIAFSDNHYKLFRNPRPATLHNKQRALKFLRDMRAEGGTRMLTAVYEAIFTKSSLISAPQGEQIVLLTDGAIDYETEMMAIVNEHIGDKRLHIVGIGNAPNSFLIKGLAKVGKGSHLYVNHDITNKITELLFKINHPVIENLKMRIAKEHEVLPKKFPDVMAGDPITFFIKVNDSSLSSLTSPFQIYGNKNSKKWKFLITPGQIQKGAYLDQLWGREKVEEVSFQNAIGFINDHDHEILVKKLGLKHHLITKFTSLVAVDPIVSRSQVSPLLSHQIAQNIPDGWESPLLKDKISSLQNNGIIDLQKPIDILHKVDINDVQPIKINFSQTATSKNLYLFLTILLLMFSVYFFKMYRRIN